MSISLDDDVFEVETMDGLPITHPTSLPGPTEEAVRRIAVTIDGESYDFRLSVEKES